MPSNEGEEWRADEFSRSPTQGLGNQRQNQTGCERVSHTHTIVSVIISVLCVSTDRDDLARAIKKLRILGAGFAVIPMKGGRLVQSVPGELNMDHTAVLQKAEVRGENTREYLFQCVCVCVCVCV